MSERKKKKVLIVLYYYHPYVSGVSIYAKRLAEELVKRGFSVTVLTSRHIKESLKEEIINGVKVIRHPVLFKLGKGVIMPFFWFSIIRFSVKNDFVNPHLPLADMGLSSLFISKKKIITTYQCDINLGKKLIDRLITAISLFFMKIVLYRSKAIAVLSKDYFENSKMKGFNHKAVEMLAPVDKNEFKKTDYKTLEKKLSLGKGERIGFVGRIVYEKGIQYLIQSLDYLIDEFPNIKILIAGDSKNIAGGGVKEELDLYIKKHPDRIVFTGFLDDFELKQFYSMIDVLVLPSIDSLDAFGMVQVEAMLSETPVVASNIPGIRVVVKKTGFGLLSAPKDPVDIAKKVSKVLSDKKRFTPDRATVIREFNLPEFIDRYVNLFN